MILFDKRRFSVDERQFLWRSDAFVAARAGVRWVRTGVVEADYGVVEQVVRGVVLFVSKSV